MADRIVVATSPSDQGDILQDFIEWHLGLGVDLVLAHDCNSSDNTRALLDSYARKGQVHWVSMAETDFRHYRPSAAMTRIAREELKADWIIMNDVDEFLCPLGDDLRNILDRARSDEITALSVPCFNMTGRQSFGNLATGKLTLRIDQPVTTTLEQRVSDNLPRPYIFIQHPPKTIVWAAALTEYGAGTHEVKTAWGRSTGSSEFRILHFPIRSFEKFETKVKNVTAFFEANDHFEEWWGWHWRRWIRANKAGRLRQEYEDQFVSPDEAAKLISEGVCSIDRTIANWVKDKNKSALHRFADRGFARLERLFR